MQFRSLLVISFIVGAVLMIPGKASADGLFGVVDEVGDTVSEVTNQADQSDKTENNANTKETSSADQLKDSDSDENSEKKSQQKNEDSLSLELNETVDTVSNIVNETTEDVDQVTDNVADTTESVDEVTKEITNVTEDVTDTVSETTENVTEVTESTVEASEEVTDTVTDATEEVTDTVTDSTENVNADFEANVNIDTKEKADAGTSVEITEPNVGAEVKMDTNSEEVGKDSENIFHNEFSFERIEEARGKIDVVEESVEDQSKFDSPSINRQSFTKANQSGQNKDSNKKKQVKLPGSAAILAPSPQTPAPGSTFQGGNGQSGNSFSSAYGMMADDMQMNKILANPMVSFTKSIGSQWDNAPPSPPPKKASSFSKQFMT